MKSSAERELLLHHYKEIKDQIEKACSTSKRNSHEVKLVVISKFQPETKIRWLLEAGHREFGESRVEELQKKWEPLLPIYPDIRLHYIGKIQSRKIRHIVRYCHIVHSLDRIDIAKIIASECIKQNKFIECLIQINTGAESQKSGIDPYYFPIFLQECRMIRQLIIQGIMCIPPANQDPLPHFHLMQNLKNNFGLNELSMGMSNDYIDAIQCGATMLRIGTKIMGYRQ